MVESNVSRNSMSLAMEFADLGVFDWDLVENTVYLSPIYKQLLGYQDDELENSYNSWEGLIHPDDVQTALQLFQDPKKIAESRFEIELRMFHKNGQLVDILSKGNVVLDEAGKPIRVVSIHQDISEKKRAETKAQSYAEALETIFSNTPNFLAIIDNSLQVERLNRKGYEVSVKKPGEVTGALPGELLGCLNSFSEGGCGTTHECIDCPIRRQLYDVFESGKAQAEEELQLTVKGECWHIDYFYLVSARPIRIDGQVKALLSLSDITTYRKIKEKLSATEETQQYLFDNSPVALFIQDFSEVVVKVEELKQSGVNDLEAYLSKNREELNAIVGLVKITEANNAACELFQCSLKQLLEGGLQAIIVPGEEQYLIRQIVDFGEGKTRFASEAVQKSYTGETLQLFLTKAAVQAEQGFKKIIVSAMDLTELYTIRNEKQALSDQLQQAQKMEAIGTLAGGIAHDFNNILSAIIGFTELAFEDSKSNIPLLNQDLKEVYTGAIRAKELVKQILTFARESSEELGPLQVATVVDEAVKFIRSSAPATIGIEETVQTKSWILGNSVQLHQILMNICINAIHAMEDEGGTLKIHAADVYFPSQKVQHGIVLEQGAFVELQIIDTGPGIPPENLSSIFDPYYTTKTQHEGTGLGLSIVHGIVESYGGKIAVESRLGEGTSFYIYLPTTPPAEEKPTKVEDEDLAHGTEKILLVDDETPITILGQKLLSGLGYSVITYNDSKKALKDFAARPDYYDLVITDLTMPELSGDKLIEKLYEIREDIPVILCSGYSKKLKNGLVSHPAIKAIYQKPIVKSEMATLIRKVLN